MGVIRNAINQKIKGRVGAVTYYVSEGRQIARQALNNSNYGKTASRSEAQQSQRIKWANLVNFYKVCKNWMPKAFEGKKPGQSDYNRLMQVNMPYTDIYLTKNLATVGACVVEDYIISQGSLPSVGIVNVGNYWRTNIYVGALDIDEDTTVAGFTQALVANNTNIEIGMQLSFVSLMQSVDNLGIPRLVCTFYEVTLSLENENELYDYLPSFCTSVHDGCLCTSNTIAIGAFAYVVSDLRKGALQVSTQQLITNNTDLISQFSDNNARIKAIESYGLDPDVILSPLTENEQGATPVPFFITVFYAGQQSYFANKPIPVVSELATPWLLGFSSKISVADVDSVEIRTNGGSSYVTEYIQSGGNVLSVDKPSTIGASDYITQFKVIMTTGIVLEINFTPAN